MKFYDCSTAPSARRVRIFMAEKGIGVPTVQVDLRNGEQFSDAFRKINPDCTVPVLELDDGTVIADAIAIYGYLEEIHPEPALIGRTPEERAETRMWQRRMELRITEHLYNGFRFAEGLELFRPRMRVLPEAADGLKAVARDGLLWLERLFGDRAYVVGDRFTIADVILYCALDFGGSVGQPLDPAHAALGRWFDRVASRPSAQDSLHPQSKTVGLRG